MSEGAISVLSTKLQVLHSDVSEIKDALRTLSDAITKLALVEERQTQTAQALERCFVAIEKIERRVDALERANMNNNRVSAWIDKAIIGIVILVAMLVAKKVGLT